MMKVVIAAALMLAALVSPAYAQAPYASQFVSSARIRYVSLSPDGRCIAFISESADGEYLAFTDISAEH